MPGLAVVGARCWGAIPSPPACCVPHHGCHCCHSTCDPSHKQLLVRLGAGGALSVTIWGQSSPRHHCHHFVGNKKMKQTKKKTYLWFKRHRCLLGLFLCPSLYSTGPITSTFCSCPVLVVPLIVHHCHFCYVVSLSIPIPIPVIIL